MIPAYEQNVLFFQGSNDAGKNELVCQFTCLQPHFYIKLKKKKENIINNE